LEINSNITSVRELINGNATNLLHRDKCRSAKKMLHTCFNLNQFWHLQREWEARKDRSEGRTSTNIFLTSCINLYVKIEY
jgi:hypothetical protein